MTNNELNTHGECKHQGTIIKLDGHIASVKIINQSACSQCHAKEFCTSLEMKEKIIDAQITEENETSLDQYKVGDTVEVRMHESKGMQAALLAYIIPFLVLVIGIILGTIITHNEIKAAISSFALLALYYGILYLANKRLKKMFVFTIRKTS